LAPEQLTAEAALRVALLDLGHPEAGAAPAATGDFTVSGVAGAPAQDASDRARHTLINARLSMALTSNSS